MTIARMLVILALASSIAPLFAQGSTPSQTQTKAYLTACASAFVLSTPVEVEKDFIPSGWIGDGEKGKEYLQLTYVTGENPRPNDENNVVTEDPLPGWEHRLGGNILAVARK